MSLGGIASKAIYGLDFSAPFTPKPQVGVQYGMTVLARLGASRQDPAYSILNPGKSQPLTDRLEFKENMRRDVPGWLTLMCLAAMVENVAGTVLDSVGKVVTKSGEAVSLFKNAEGLNFLQKMNPFGKAKMRSFEDIEKGLAHVLDEKNITKLKVKKAGVYLTGLAASVAMLGIIIPKLNVKLAKAEVEKQKEKLAAVSLSQDVNAPALKPATCEHQAQKGNNAPSFEAKPVKGVNTSVFNQFV